MYIQLGSYPSRKYFNDFVLLEGQKFIRRGMLMEWKGLSPVPIRYIMQGKFLDQSPT